MASYHKNVAAQEVPYQRQDLANNMFLVVSGTFEHIAMPTTNGGKDVRFLMGLDEDAKPNLFPYQLFSSRGYFGDELLFGAHHRVACVRCEVQGTVLVVPRADLSKLLGRFPELADMWGKEARRREFHRQRLVVCLSVGHSFRHFAAITIQRFARSAKDKVGRAGAICDIVEVYQRHRYGSKRFLRRFPAAAAAESPEEHEQTRDACEGIPAQVTELQDDDGAVCSNNAGENELKVVMEELRALRKDMGLMQSQVAELSANSAMSVQRSMSGGSASTGDMRVMMEEIRSVRRDMVTMQTQVQNEFHALRRGSTTDEI